MKKIFIIGSILQFSSLFSQPFSSSNLITSSQDGPRKIAMGDIDNDGDLDVIVGSGHNGATSGLNISSYLNDGSGNYIFGSQISSNTEEISDIELGDTDGDGDLDLFVANSRYSSGGSYWFKNNGNGTYGSRITLHTGPPNCHQIILADVDNDGFVDVLGTSETSDRVYYFKNTGFGAFSGMNTIFGISESGGVHTVAAGDIDYDGKTEIIIGNDFNSDAGIIHYLLSYEYNLGFTRYEIAASSYSSNIYQDIFAVDFKGDSNIDLVETSSSLKSYRTNGHNSYTYSGTLSFTGTVLGWGDIDGDGYLDALINPNNSGKLSWYKNLKLTTGGFASIENTISTNSWSDPIVGDIDGDGDIDVAALNYLTDQVVWFENLRINCATTYDTINDTICQGDSLLFGANYLKTIGFYSDTLTSIGNCDSIVTLNLAVTSNVTPTIVISATPSSTVCQGESIVFNSVITNGGVSPSYQWKRNGNNVGIGLTSYSPNSSSNNSGDDITCELTSNAVCVTTSSLVSNSINLSIIPLPVVSINQNGSVLEATIGFSSYKWKYNGVVMSGEVNANHTPSQNGVFEVVVTNSGGCKDSTVFNFNSLSIDNKHEELLFNVYPNPSTGEFFIETDLKGILTYSIFGVNGRLIKTGSLIDKNQLNIIDIDNGIYVLKVSNEKSVITKRLIIEKK